MKPIEPPDSLHLQAAIGWLELGNPTEAREELAKIAPSLRRRPEVLEAQWGICAKLKQWDICLGLADEMIASAPELPVGWAKKAVAFHGLKEYQKAWDTLYPAVQKFPSVKPLTYDLACYACLLGNLEKAKELLQKVFEGEDNKIWKDIALKDTDLEALWDHIRDF